jgi:uncharacterized SAM-binding protein YcdF (DUF218 family)
MLKRLLVLVLIAWIAATVVLFVVPHGEKPIHADAVLVLSGSAKRLPVGLRLVRQGYAPLLVVSRTRPHPSRLEAQACAHRIGVRVVCFEAHPYSTMGEAEELARLAAARHWQAVDVVTSQYHVVRARIIIQRCYHGRLRVVGAPNSLPQLPYNAAFESVKLLYHELIHRAC